MESKTNRKGPAIKAAIFILFIVTALGIIVGTFIFTFFVGTIKEIWSSGQWAGLLSWKVFVSIGLFIFSFFIPRIVEWIKASRKVRAF